MSTRETVDMRKVQGVVNATLDECVERDMTVLESFLVGTELVEAFKRWVVGGRSPYALFDGGEDA